jgi:chemotaxis protein CheD
MYGRAKLVGAEATAEIDKGEAAIDLLEAPALKEVYLHPGQMYASAGPTQISMILGSCVSVCLFDQRLSLGGATHYMLAQWNGNGQPSTRFGDVAIDSLLRRLQSFGSDSRDLRAKVFGGACMFQSFRNVSGDHIGARNVDIASNILMRHGIAIVTKNTGGNKGRKLKMQTDTGQATVKIIENP